MKYSIYTTIWTKFPFSKNESDVLMNKKTLLITENANPDFVFLNLKSSQFLAMFKLHVL